ncbi:FixH family protein [Algoriphagus sp. CAU 1675]|uniref:FixH family protein n=1 Tax=Algoriphagus sp. CAU 1675 TaxID=3032597 RepID=UPI0023DCD9CD|nr:FixH family protein [Algoriphagus sp. CAU 1675]MDF2158630.1 FixH family protein [Algoriphagus sp. CAU 1675]
MNWGKGILLSIIAFVGIILTMVVISVRMEGIELVTENYYEQEIKYQDQIDKQMSTLALDREVLVFDASNKTLVLDLPIGAKGKLNFFRPSDEKLDQEFLLNIMEEKNKTIPVHSLKEGYWKVQLSWTENGTSYYQEKKINL